MRKFFVLFASCLCFLPNADANFELLGCNIDVEIPKERMAAIVNVESGFQQYAIGVVGGYLSRQPANLTEAFSMVELLELNSMNYSVGLAQVNRSNFAANNLTSANMFEICPNLRAGAQILSSCYRRFGDWEKAYSCYYSGNATTGFTHGYVQKVNASYGKSIPQQVKTPKNSDVGLRFVARQTKVNSAQPAARHVQASVAKPASLSTRRLMSSIGIKPNSKPVSSQIAPLAAANSRKNSSLSSRRLASSL